MRVIYLNGALEIYLDRAGHRCMVSHYRNTLAGELYLRARLPLLLRDRLSADYAWRWAVRSAVLRSR